LQERHVGTGVNWNRTPADIPPVLVALFDSVAENLLHNARNKRQREPGIKISAILGVDRNRPSLCISDNGSAIPLDRATSLLHETVKSEDGLGIGLYHAARQAEANGYTLALSENNNGKVSFSLTAQA
jgi:C4-dicarboxylate-specific signal transduction histidine kinase